MASINNSTLACSYAISWVGSSKLSSKPSCLGVTKTKRFPMIKAQAEASTEDLEKVDKLRRASLFGLGAALVTTPFSSSAFAAVIDPPKVIKVIGISGSLAKVSRNRALIQAAIDISKDKKLGVEVELLDISQLPVINPDTIVGGKCPPDVEAIRQKIKAADSFLFATTEYNYSVTPTMKNVLDWGSIDPNVWDNKPAAIMSAGYELGGGLSQYNLRQIGVRPNIHFINGPQLFVRINSKPPPFDSNNNLVDKDALQTIEEILIALKNFTQVIQQ